MRGECRGPFISNQFSENYGLNSQGEAHLFPIDSEHCSTQIGFIMKRILRGKDDPVFSEVLETHLTSAGHQVQMASDVETGLKLAGQGSLDLIFLDVMLPDIDGYEFCATIRKAKATKNVPVIMLTGEDKMVSVWAGMESGATDYIFKNAPMEIVLSRMNELIEKYAV